MKHQRINKKNKKIKIQAIRKKKKITSSVFYLRVEGEHGLDGYIGRAKLVGLEHLLDQFLPVLHGVLRRLRQHDLVLLRANLHIILQNVFYKIQFYFTCFWSRILSVTTPVWTFWIHYKQARELAMHPYLHLFVESVVPQVLHIIPVPYYAVLNLQ